MMPAKGFRTVLLMAFVGAIAALLASLGIGDTALAESDDAGGETVVIELRVWQHVDDAEDVWLSARPRGGRWDTLGTIPFRLVNHGWPTGVRQFHRFADLAIAGAELRVWQRATSRPNLSTSAPAPARAPATSGPPAPWTGRFQRPPRLRGGPHSVPVPLDDGLSSGGTYRYATSSLRYPRGIRDCYRTASTCWH